MKKYFMLILLFVSLFLCAYFAYREINSIYITAKFEELRPIKNRIPVYYKGIKIGIAKDMKHSKDYMHTLLRIQIFGNTLKIPDNTIVYLKKDIQENKNTKDYLEFVIKDTPSTTYLKNGSVIEGKCSVDMAHFLSNQEPDDIDNIKENLAQASENLNTTLEGVIELTNMLEEIVAENRNSLKTTVNNIENSTQNVDNLSSKINDAVTEENLSTTINNIKNITEKSFEITDKVSKTDINGINKLITTTNCILDDTNCIVNGIRNTMSKRFGGMRLIFGKVVD